MRRPKFLQKIIENPEYFLLVFLASIVDARSTTMNDLGGSTTELNPLAAYLIHNLPSTTANLLMILIPVLVSTLFFQLWATPSKRSIGFYSLNAIIITQTIAAINNTLIYQGIFHPIFTATIILTMTTIVITGHRKDQKRKQRKKEIEKLPKP